MENKNKTLYCSCGNEVIVPNMDKIIDVKCWRCTCIMSFPKEDEIQSVDNKDKRYKKPKDWIYLDEFIDMFGNIYKFGKKVGENGTPTDLTNIKKRIKQAKEASLVKKGKEIIKIKKGIKKHAE